MCAIHWQQRVMIRTSVLLALSQCGQTFYIFIYVGSVLQFQCLLDLIWWLLEYIWLFPFVVLLCVKAVQKSFKKGVAAIIPQFSLWLTAFFELQLENVANLLSNRPKFASILLVHWRNFKALDVKTSQQDVCMPMFAYRKLRCLWNLPVVSPETKCDDYPQSDELTPTHAGIHHPFSHPTFPSLVLPSSPTIMRLK